jgi:ADP-heptose:LPS heptosyltransferase
VVLDYTGTDRSALLALMSGAPVRAGYEKFAGGWLRQAACTLSCGASVRELHTIDFHHALARAAGLGLSPVPDCGHLRLPAGLGLPVLPDRYCLIHPGTAREEKFWPASSWSALLNHLHGQHGLPIVLTGGDWEYERQHIAEILSGTGVPVMDLRGTLSLPQWAGVTAGARLAITVDTAAMHVASAFRIPQVALFGPTNPWHWAPRQTGAAVLRAGAAPGLPMNPKQSGGRMESLLWQTAAEAVDALLAASGSPQTAGHPEPPVATRTQSVG